MEGLGQRAPAPNFHYEDMGVGRNVHFPVLIFFPFLPQIDGALMQVQRHGCHAADRQPMARRLRKVRRIGETSSLVGSPKTCTVHGECGQTS